MARGGRLVAFVKKIYWLWCDIIHVISKEYSHFVTDVMWLINVSCATNKFSPQLPQLYSRSEKLLISKLGQFIIANHQFHKLQLQQMAISGLSSSPHNWFYQHSKSILSLNLFESTTHVLVWQWKQTPTKVIIFTFCYPIGTARYEIKVLPGSFPHFLSKRAWDQGYLQL